MAAIPSNENSRISIFGGENQFSIYEKWVLLWLQICNNGALRLIFTCEGILSSIVVGMKLRYFEALCKTDALKRILHSEAPKIMDGLLYE